MKDTRGRHHRKPNLWGLLALCLALLAGCARPTALSDLPYEGLYSRDQPVVIRARPLLDSSGNMRCFTEIVARKIPVGLPKSVLLERYLITCRVSPDYQTRTILRLDTVNLHQLSRDADGIFHFWFPLPNLTTNAVVAITVKERQTDRETVLDVPLELNYTSQYYRYAVFPVNRNYPFAGNYFRQRDTVAIRTFASDSRPLFVRFYGNNLPAALPAMTMKAPPPLGKALARYQMTTGKPLTFDAPGLYLCQEDTNQRDGFCFLIGTNKYPYLSREPDLQAPLLYVTAADERRKLSDAPRLKVALDQFWLGVGGSRDHARRVLRDYYEGVELANEQFTSLKEGWKTDRGMIYVVFGPPDRVIKSNMQEEWIYQSAGAYEDISFLFVKKPTIFTPENYELVRSPEYERIWYSRVDQWRKGTLRR